MKPIDAQFTKDGWDHTLVERSGLVAIFERSKDGGKQSHFETVVLREDKAKSASFPPTPKHPNGRKVDYPAQERYPSNEDWGNYGWTYKTLQEARLKASALLATQPQTHP